MAPLIMPEYHSTLFYLTVNGNYLLAILYEMGRIQVIMSLRQGKTQTKKKPIPTADHRPLTPKSDAPKYAKMKAYAIYLAV